MFGIFNFLAQNRSTFVLWGIVDKKAYSSCLLTKSKCGQFFQYFEYAPRNWTRTRVVASLMCQSSLVACAKDPIMWWRAMWARNALEHASLREKGTTQHSVPRAQRPLDAKGMDCFRVHYDRKGDAPVKFEALSSACQIVNERLMKCVQPAQKNKAELMPFKQHF